MPAYKEKDRNTWTVKFKHKNWSGKIKWVTKRGFATKRDALQYERDFLARKSGDLDMSFADFVQVYREERGARIKESTLSMKDNIIDTKLIPYFGKMYARDHHQGHYALAKRAADLPRSQGWQALFQIVPENDS